MLRVKEQDVDLRGVRYADGRLESAVQRYQRGEDGRTILLVSTIHLAEPDHYTELRKIVDEAVAQGYVVHCEGSDATDGTPTTAAERDAVNRTEAGLRSQFREIPKTFGLNWVYQEDGDMARDEGWCGFDVRRLDVVRLFGPGNSALITPVDSRVRPRVDVKPGSLPWLRARAVFIKSYLATGKHRRSRVQRIIYRLRRVTPVPAWAHQVMYSYREFLAALAALETESNLVLLWHGNHFPGIGGVLLRNNFALTDVRWLTAIHGRAALLDKQCIEKVGG